jgi:predicted ArsR family transcriptional regulator
MPGEQPKSPHDAASDLERQLGGLAALDDPMRRTLYEHVATAARDVSRDEAARAVGISRSLAGFHLDRLVSEGLLAASFRRLTGRSGPGAGRPAKLYRRSDRQLEVSLPPRRYELAARLLADALDGSAATNPRKNLSKGARERGVRIGAEVRARVGARAGRKRLLESLLEALAAQGYEPELDGSELRLRNCPFHALVSDHTQLVCGMNLALLEGVVAGLGMPGAKPVLAPRSGLCCVSLLLEADAHRGPALTASRDHGDRETRPEEGTDAPDRLR